MRSTVAKAGLVIVGGAVQGLGMGLFLFPNFIPSGGAGGITVLLNYWFQIGMGTALWIVNFSLLLLGIFVLGKRFAFWTVIAITVTSLTVDYFEQITILNRHIVSDLIIGSMFLGIGIGILMRQNVSNGGIGVVALILAKKYKILPGYSLLWINSCIFVIAAIIIDWKIIFLALLSQWISTQIVNMIMEFGFMETSESYTIGWRKKP